MLFKFSDDDKKKFWANVILWELKNLNEPMNHFY